MYAIAYTDILKTLKRMQLPVIDLVVGIGSGGVVPAALVAGKLGCDLRIIHFKYRDKNNKAAYRHPVHKGVFALPKETRKVLLVDDVSVSGKTLRAARKLLKGCQIKTMVFKGRADFVLLPEITECVHWPWKT